MRQWELWGNRESGRYFTLRNRIKALPQRHAPQQQVSCSGLSTYSIQLCKGLPRLRIAFGHDVAKTEDVDGVDICVRVPRTNLFQGWNGFRWPSSRVIRQPKELHGIAVLRIFLPRVFKIFSSFEVFSLVVIGDTQFVLESF